MAVAEIWPVEPVSDDFFEPVSVDVPTLLLSGSHDPSTAASWGDEAARHLPNGLHVVVPGGHGVSGPEVARLDRAFLEAGSIEGLDTSEVDALELPPLVIPGG
jgi:pimeloyl-ACP methyl ester carboxylesterase